MDILIAILIYIVVFTLVTGVSYKYLRLKPYAAINFGFVLSFLTLILIYPPSSLMDETPRTAIIFYLLLLILSGFYIFMYSVIRCMFDSY